MAKVKVVGYESFNSKKGNKCVMLHVMKDIDKREAHIAVHGQQVVSYYVPDHLQQKATPALVGKEVEIYSAFFSNRDNLLDIVQ